jgi:uncharacterized protein YndB with AHSA1/START domain
MEQIHPLQFEVDVAAPVIEVWHAWTTEEGAITFFAPKCRIDLKPGGSYEMYFDLEAPAGLRGSEGCVLLAYEEPVMLSFSWNAPPHLPAVRDQRTHVMVTLVPIDPGNTRVTLTHDGWGSGEDWQKARQYFLRAWGEGVLPLLQKRFIIGALDWGIH